MPKKERQLSPLELKHKKVFDTKAQALAQEGYTKKELSITPFTGANVLGLAIMLPIGAILIWLYTSLNDKNFFTDFSLLMGPFWGRIIGFFPVAVALAVLYQVLHGLIWAIFTKDRWKNIEMRCIPRALMMPFCSCKVPLKKTEYILGLIIPTIVAGLIPAIIGIVSGNRFFFYLGLLVTLAAGVDVLTALKMIFFKETKKSCIYLAHPSEWGTVAFERK